MRCARENETAPVRQKLPGPVLVFLNYKPEYVPNTLCKPGIYATFLDKKFSPFGRPVLDYLAADGAGFTGGQVTVVTVGQVNANLGCSLHLELVHGLTSLRNVNLIVVLHSDSLLFLFAVFRIHSFAEFAGNMIVSFRNLTQKLEKRGYLQKARFGEMPNRAYFLYMKDFSS